MVEITPKTYLDSMVSRLKGGEVYTWHDKELKASALEKAEALMFAEYNGWGNQVEKLKNEVFTCVVHDRAMESIHFIKNIGGNPKLFAFVDNIGSKITSVGHDWKLKPVHVHSGLIPCNATYLAAHLKRSGLDFDGYYVCEPVPKPYVPPPRDPVLVGALSAPLGHFLVEISRWDGNLGTGMGLMQNIELNRFGNVRAVTKEQEKWIFIGMSLVVGFFFFLIAKGFWGFVLGAGLGYGIFRVLNHIRQNMD
ncbi:MAG: hypothetical protein ABSB22_12730 [Thermodesulfobacteriota bacterium]